MLNWVVKVVPQLPEPSAKTSQEQTEAPPPTKAPPTAIEKRVKFQDEVQLEAQKGEKPKQEVKPAAGNGPALQSQSQSQSRPRSSSHPGVLTWISGALPQPPVSPVLSRAKEEPPESDRPEDERGVIFWISHGLEKVIPQPDQKCKEAPAAAEPPAEVCVLCLQVCVVCFQVCVPAEPLVTEVELNRDNSRTFQPRMMDWIKYGIEKVVPQPEINARVKTEASEPAPPTESSKTTNESQRSSKDASQQSNVMGWIVNGFGRILPQPVERADSVNNDVQNRVETCRDP